MTTRAYFVGGPADGRTQDSTHTPPELFQVRNQQQTLPFDGNGVIEHTYYELHRIVSEDGKVLYIYTPVRSDVSTEMRRVLEAYAESKREVAHA